jgi:hypothetical protein
MRSVVKRVLVALVAVFAFGALVSASASAALPEFSGVKPTTFTGSGGQVLFEEEGGSKYACQSSSITGTITGPKEVSNIVVKFPGCASFCATVATKALETKELKGRLAYISKAEKTVGLLLEPVAEPIAECITHAGFAAKIQGSIIGRLGVVNIRQKSFKLEFQKEGEKQRWRHFEGEALLHELQILRVPFPSPFALRLESTMTLSTAHEIEIMA